MTSHVTPAAESDLDLHRTPASLWRLPDLHIPTAMLESNSGCGSSVDPHDLHGGDTILYVGVGGGLEALQFAYFTRRRGSVIVVDPAAAMRERASANFAEAARLNPWFDPAYITLLDGNALCLPVDDNRVTVLAQNGLSNGFTRANLVQALEEVTRVLMPGGLFCTSDPLTPVPLPDELKTDELLRARRVAGCQTFDAHIKVLTDAGFGRVEVRSRTPYRYLDPTEYPALAAPVMLESVEVAAYQVSEGPYGPEVFTGRMAVYAGPDPSQNDGHGHMLRRGVPLAVSDAAAEHLAKMPGVVVTDPTYHYRGGFG
jgi:ubiquinone/menaquinone biosynthesis C-methylase UbiE